MKLISPVITRGRGRTLAVEAGQVVCPRRGPVDVELCWTCPAFGGLIAGRHEDVVCRSSSMAQLFELRSVVA